MIEINNLTAISFDSSFLKKVIKAVLKGEKRKNYYLSVAFLGKVRMKFLNKKYLTRDYATDVLSFPENSDLIVSFHKEEIYPKESLGEILICPQIVKLNAAKNKSFFKKELSKVLIHGVLHLLNYDHEKSLDQEKKMNKKEQIYLKQFFP